MSELSEIIPRFLTAERLNGAKRPREPAEMSRGSDINCPSWVVVSQPLAHADIVWIYLKKKKMHLYICIYILNRKYGECQVGDIEIAASIATTLTTIENVLFLRFFKETLKSLVKLLKVNY